MRHRIATICTIFVLAPLLAHGAEILCANLTTTGASGGCNGAFFLQIPAQSTGSGVIDPFVRLQTNNSIEKGFNTDARPYAANNDAQVTATFDHSEAETAFQQVTGGTVINGTSIPGGAGQLYLEIMLDINQTGANPFLSLDQMVVTLSNSPNDNPAISLNGVIPNAPGLAGSPIYNLDGGGFDRWIAMNFALNSGSGSGDVLAFIPVTLAQIAACGAGCDVEVYSAFGVVGSYAGGGPLQAGVLDAPVAGYGNNDGYEEWSTIKGAIAPGPEPTPEPSPFMLVLAGIGLIAACRKRSFLRV